MAHDVMAPLLYVRVQGPVGMTVTFLEGPRVAKSFDPPVTVGLRPGYAYRLRIDGVPDHPDLKLYPTLEVGGTLCLPPRLKAADFPALLQFTEADLVRAASGALITKVIVVEDPDSAPFPLQDPEHPNEWELRPHEDPIEQAKSFGRSVLILWLGLREPDAADLARLKPGLILYPDMKTLPPTNLPPTVDCSQFFDRRHLVNDPVECIRDGGDRGQPAFFEPNGNIRGINPSDTVAEYKDVAGNRRLAVTNEVCVFAPRFLAVRHELPPLVVETVKPLISVNNQQGNRQLAVKQNTKQAAQADDLQAVQARDRLRAGIGKNQLMQIIDMQVLDGVDINIGIAKEFGTAKASLLSERDKAKLAKQIELALNLSRGVGVKSVSEAFGPRVVGVVDEVGNVSATAEACTAVYFCEKTEKLLPEKPLMVYKWASAEGAKVGDIVTFYIRYNNHGGKPIRDIAVVDSLSKRLEYIPGSAKSDREAILVTQDNEAGSVTLRWEIRNSLPPCEQGVVSFQARVR
jgi:uncharacterized repeat protein (TIGR01451 family)